ncbi:hypothetical protein V3C99_001482 [Haemonchus contortus]
MQNLRLCLSFCSIYIAHSLLLNSTASQITSFTTPNSDGFTEDVFIPSNLMYDNKTVVPKPFHHIYTLQTCSFRILFTNPNCDQNANHTVMLLFFTNFFELQRQIKNGTMPNAIVFSRNISESPYSYSVLSRGDGKNFTRCEFNESHSEVEVHVSLQKIVEIRLPSETLKLKLTGSPKHFALFSTPPSSCSAVLSQISSSFPIWIPGRPIPVQGIEQKAPPDPTTLRDVIVAVIFIIVYYIVLVNFILPPYFNKCFPLAER